MAEESVVFAGHAAHIGELFVHLENIIAAIKRKQVSRNLTVGGGGGPKQTGKKQAKKEIKEKGI